MTSLNKSVANSPDGYTLSMYEYWDLLESSAYAQQAEVGSYDPIKVVSSKEATPISVNLTFHISPGSKFVVNDLHNAYIPLQVERTFIYTNSAGSAVAHDLLVFVRDKHASNFIKQFRIFCNDTTRTENLDFVYELNILGATIPDSIKSTKPETYTPISNLVINDIAASSVTDRERAGCGQYVNFNAIASGTSITLKYFLTIPMSTFNLFNKLRYLPTFFGNWTLDIIPTLDNMFIKIISYNRISQLSNYHVTKQKVYQCYGLGSEVPYTTTAAGAATAWIKLAPQSYKITSANFYTSQF
jgi:hypothetical protein